MAQRSRPVTKRPDEVLDDVFAGYDDAAALGKTEAKRYLVNYLEKYNSIPNAVKFFIYDLLAEAAYQADDAQLCHQAAQEASKYLPFAQEESARRFKEYFPKIRFLERGISVFVDAGEFNAAVTLCDQAIALGLGKAYAAKRASIENMMG